MTFWRLPASRTAGSNYSFAFDQSPANSLLTRSSTSPGQGEGQNDEDSTRGSCARPAVPLQTTFASLAGCGT